MTTLRLRHTRIAEEAAMSSPGLSWAVGAVGAERPAWFGGEGKGVVGDCQLAPGLAWFARPAALEDVQHALSCHLYSHPCIGAWDNYALRSRRPARRHPSTKRMAFSAGYARGFHGCMGGSLDE